uniref:DUF4352 domain-containing protein n=1 Tax=Thermofilum pendens TaxID=2269 RepID=A0A7J3X950_THEPE
MKPGLRRRRAALPPIATVLIVIAAVVATGLVAWLLYSTTARAARTPIVSVVGVPTLYASGDSTYLYVTLKNDGTAPLNITNAKVVVSTASGSITFTCMNTTSIDAGRAASLVFQASGNQLANIPDGALATLQTTDGYQLSFAVAKPG